MDEATPLAKQKCSYKHEEWSCPFDAEDGHDFCIFHLPIDKKKPEDFWRHMASYLLALRWPTPPTIGDVLLGDQDRHRLSFGDERATDLVERYRSQISNGEVWRFTGFVFPEMDAKHNFQDFEFPKCNFSLAEFRGFASFENAIFAEDTDFYACAFNGEADLSGVRFSGDAQFAEAKFSAQASFTRAKFGALASFTFATFSAKAEFQRAEFRGVAEFSEVTFTDEALFAGAAFKSNASFVLTDFHGMAYYWGTEFDTDVQFVHAGFDAEAKFSNTKFHGTSDFSFATFASPPYFHSAVFYGRLDFYEARIPGLSKDDDERTARTIRLQAEKHGSYADAGDFYIIEMGFRRKRFRKDPKRWLQYGLMEAYRWTSGYGDKIGRALASLLVCLSLFSYFFVIAGFEFMGRPVNRDLRFDLSQFWPTVSDLWLAFRMALANLMPGNLRADVLGLKLTSEASKSWAVAQVICTYILITLLLLAIRRRFKR